ncbi:type I-C CRISPR-associated protein Cas8c/Csd1 [Paenibacillus thalictri]|uniref:Type I-C CRISPR-associated protein Cas8c/Csd1 n=1 Tax=Paenibacillus thalictri TaxID=2527873 RepID=A0A4Q9DUQ6_9BACL|nr:type I-C CRISPR-associated protein Cas8c/Csd1 [Paenibacillus thalictri]TBL80095.1 type I-C CRISPR-associated protein Cas8c/Csd1 [Paenibacillus thalictri]
MILQSLVAYYDRMAEEYPLDVAQPGYAVTPISKCIVIDEEGEVLIVLNRMIAREVTGKNGKKETKFFPERMITPQQPKRSGSRPEAAFLCENANFLFGIYGDQAGADYRFEASGKLHEQVLHDVDDKGARAILAFFRKRKPGSLDYGNVDMSSLNDGGNIVFKLEEDTDQYIHERDAIKDAWEKFLSGKSEGASIGQCLVTGKIGPIARIHGNLEGFGQDKPTLVGFNQSSFVSYGKEKGDNAPVSVTAAFKYVTALNMLISDRDHCANIHGDKLLFWAEKRAPLEEQAVAAMIRGQRPEADSKLDAVTGRKMASVMEHLYKGTRPEELELDINVRIFVLGITANKTRTVIRFFYVNTFGQIIERFQQHHRDIYIEGPGWEPEHPSFDKILIETAVRRESRNVPAPHQVALVRSVMNSTTYPNSLFIAMLTRVRAEASADMKLAINRTRIGFIKGYLNRIARQSQQKEEFGVTLNYGETSIAYKLGCILAILNKAQSDALEKVNASIVDKFLSAALASPQQVFPTLLNNSENHFSKSKKYFTRKLLLEVMEHIPPEGFPKTLNAEGQGQFLVGFYHQQQMFFKGKDKQGAEDQPTEEAVLEHEDAHSFTLGGSNP